MFRASRSLAIEIKHKIRDKGIHVFATESINFGVVISEIVFFLALAPEKRQMEHRRKSIFAGEDVCFHHVEF